MGLSAMISRTAITFFMMLLLAHSSVCGPRVWINANGISTKSPELEKVMLSTGFWSHTSPEAYAIKAYSKSNKNNPLYLEIGQYKLSGNYFLSATTIHEGSSRVCSFTTLKPNGSANSVENIKAIGDKLASIRDSDEADWKHARLFRKLEKSTNSIFKATIQNMKRVELQWNFNLIKFWHLNSLHTFAIYNDQFGSGFYFVAYATVVIDGYKRSMCAVIVGDKKPIEWEAEQNFWNCLQSVYGFIWIELGKIYPNQTQSNYDELVAAVKAFSSWVKQIEHFEIRLDIRTAFSEEIYYIGEFKRGADIRAFFFVKTRSKIIFVGEETTPGGAVSASFL